MKSKRLILYFFVLTLTLMLILPTVNLFGFIAHNSFSKIKEIKKETILNTDKLEMLASFVVYKLFDKSIFFNNVVIGKDGFLFLGNRYAKVLNKSNGTFLITESEINRFVLKLSHLQQWYEKQGVKFVIVIAPNKHSIYEEYLPNWINKSNKTITDNIGEQSRQYGINLLDLRGILINARKNDNRLFYHKTDTHWNMLGASYGYEKVIDYMNTILNLDVIKAKYKIVHLENDNHKGDLFGFLKANDFFSINDKNTYSYHFQSQSKIYVGKINNETLELEEGNLESNPETGINWQAKYTINNQVNGSKLLFLCDSFAKNPSQLYNESFNTIWKFHHLKVPAKKLKSFIQLHKPDIVLYQIVERDFYNYKMFEILKEK